MVQELPTGLRLLHVRREQMVDLALVLAHDARDGSRTRS